MIIVYRALSEAQRDCAAGERKDKQKTRSIKEGKTFIKHQRRKKFIKLWVICLTNYLSVKINKIIFMLNKLP